MIKFAKANGFVSMVYSSSQVGVSWVCEELKREGEATISRIFKVTERELVDKCDEIDEESEIKFVVARSEGEYYCFPKHILSLEHNLYIHKDIKIDRKLFIAERGISIFGKIDALVNHPIYIGGEFENNIPIEVFNTLLKSFPNSYELKKYVNARVSAIISSYINTKEDYEVKYHEYVNKKGSFIGVDLTEKFAELEYIKYSTILNKLKSMLDNENSYSESQWQKELIQIILLVYPKYIYVFDEAPVIDSFNNKTRKVDFLLVDSSGNIDIVEIKKPFKKCIVTERTYRDNHVPLRELSGTVMQVEKYIFNLNRSGKRGEDKLRKKFKVLIPNDFKIKITNPSGLIIMGRSSNLSVAQKQDFEVIKRKYKNVIDIITYDDLIERIEYIVDSKHQV